MPGLLMRGRPPPPVRIGPPTISSVVSAASGEADVSWGAVGGATSYTVRRGLLSNANNNIYALGNVTTYHNAGIPNGVRNYYTVTALNSNGESIYSVEASVIPLAQVTGASSTAGPGLLTNTLNWTKVAGATGYTIRKGTSTGVYTITITLGDVSTYSDTGLTGGTTYYYRVYATGVNATGTDSAEFSGTPLSITFTTAIEGDSDGDYLRLQAGSYPASTGSFSGCIWANRMFDRNTYNWVWAFETPAGHSTEWTGLMLDVDGTTLYWEVTSGHVINLGTLAANTWTFLAWSVNGASVTTWTAIENQMSLTKQTAGGYAPLSNFGEIGIGASVFHAAEYYSGAVALARLWDGQLSDAEALAEYKSATVVKTSGLLGSWPLASVATDTAAAFGLSLTSSGFSSYANVAGPTIYP